MFKIKVDLKSLKKIVRDQSTLENYPQVVNQVLNDLKEATPVDTGFAQDSWAITNTSKKAVTIENSADYIKQLNSGSSTQAPKFFIENAVIKYGRVVGPVIDYF